MRHAVPAQVRLNDFRDSSDTGGFLLRRQPSSGALQFFFPLFLVFLRDCLAGRAIAGEIKSRRTDNCVVHLLNSYWLVAVPQDQQRLVGDRHVVGLLSMPSETPKKVPSVCGRLLALMSASRRSTSSLSSLSVRQLNSSV